VTFVILGPLTFFSPLNRSPVNPPPAVNPYFNFPSWQALAANYRKYDFILLQGRIRNLRFLALLYPHMRLMRMSKFSPISAVN